MRRRGVALAMMLALSAAASASAEDAAADLCFEVVASEVDAATWAALSVGVVAAAAERSALFPAPEAASVAHEALLGATPASLRLDVDAGHSGESTVHATASCLEPGLAWSARFGRAFLESGADQMLAEAPTTPGIDSSVDIEWFPLEDRLRTTLVFAGPLDIPNGTCWIDDTLTIDAVSGVAAASGEQGVKTSLFAEGACGRFFDHLPNGGAGGQVVTLLPAEVALPDGDSLRLVTDVVRVTDDAVIVGGSIEIR